MSEIIKTKRKSFREVYESLTYEDWMEIIRQANEMQRKTLKQAEDVIGEGGEVEISKSNDTFTGENPM